jgi:hypothetical protein
MYHYKTTAVFAATFLHKHGTFFLPGGAASSSLPSRASLSIEQGICCVR